MPSDVRDVMVDGSWLMRDRMMQTIEPEKAVRDALQIASRFRSRIAEIDAARV